MSIATSTSNVWTVWQWPAEVKQFAASRQGEEYLEPLREVLERLFPTAVSAEVQVYLDPELRDERHILFEVRVANSDIPEPVKTERSWCDELMRICPSDKRWLFGLYLVSLE